MKLLAEIREGFGISWAAIRANKMRSVLTTLGIIIGIVTVTLMGTAIEGLNRSFLKPFPSSGRSALRSDHRLDAAFAGGMAENAKTAPITLEQAGALEKELKLAQAVAPVSLGGTDPLQQTERERRHHRRHHGTISFHRRLFRRRGTFSFRAGG